jgi:hypothetical protein
MSEKIKHLSGGCTTSSMHHNDTNKAAEKSKAELDVLNPNPHTSL